MKTITMNTSSGKIIFRKGDDRNLSLSYLQKALIALDGVNDNSTINDVLPITNKIIGNLEYLALTGYECPGKPEAFEMFYENVTRKVREILRSYDYKDWDKI